MRKIDLSSEELEQIALHKSAVLDKVRNRFSSVAAAEAWFNSGRIPGYGDLTPEFLVRTGRADWVIEAIDAINAGVYA